MADFLESSDFSYVFTGTISTPTDIDIPKGIRQFIIAVDMDCTLLWNGNLNGVEYPIRAGEVIGIPVRCSKITITPAASGIYRIIAVG